MIKYTDSDHSYHVDGTKYISATQIISKFKGYTDWNAVAEAYSKKNGETAQFWLDKWNSKKDNACNIGSRFHKKKEDTLSPGFKELDFDTRQPISDFLEDLEDGEYAELILWLEEHRIAGQADRIILFSKGLKRFATVRDYKTNEKIDLESYKHPRTGYKMMQGPLKHLMDCNYVHYQLQLSLYAYILETNGYVIDELIVEHYPLRTPVNLLTGEGGEVDYEQEPICYKLNYLRKEIVDMLRTYKQTKK